MGDHVHWIKINRTHTCNSLAFKIVTLRQFHNSYVAYHVSIFPCVGIFLLSPFVLRHAQFP